jgi:uncharacterized protein
MQLNRFALVMLVVIGTAYAQQQQPDKHFVRASAEAVVTAQPDRGHISIGVRTQAPTAKVATEQNAAQTTEVIKTLKAILGSNGQIRTSGYSISPHYETINNGTHQNGYETSNSVDVTVDELSLLPQLIDASSSSGANNVGDISFSLKDDSALRNQALAEAGRKAKASAEAIAQALNLHVVGVANAESGVSGTPIRPMIQNLPINGRMAIATPIESGTLDVRATVTVTLEVNP